MTKLLRRRADTVFYIALDRAHTALTLTLQHKIKYHYFVMNRVEYLGSIVKYPNQGWRKLTSGYEMSLKRMARFKLLQSFQESLLRNVSQISHNWSSAEFAENLYWPGLAREMRRLEKKPQSDDDEEPDFPYFEAIKGLWRAVQPVANLSTDTLAIARPKMFSYFPRRLNVGVEDAPRLRFLSYNMVDYGRNEET